MSSNVDSALDYWKVYFALLGLTALTVGAAFVNFGPLNTVIALTIAVVKALLVVIIFMQMRHSPRLNHVFAGAGLIWLVILLTITFSDYLTRWEPFPAASKSWVQESPSHFIKKTGQPRGRAVEENRPQVH